jgi:FtsP/CotA-like multicopper oxidase with cupredoxin domain
LIQFQILDSSRGPIAPHLVGLKDTVPVEPGETVRLLVTWEGFSGIYVYHCHKLEHEDHRMMLQMRIDP